MPERKIVGIAGPSAGFKTTVAKRLMERGVGHRLPGDNAYLGEDDFVRLGRTRPMRQGHVDYESEASVELELLAEQVRALKRGATELTTPKYRRAEHCRRGTVRHEVAKDCRAVLVDSLFAHHPPLWDLLDLSVVIDITPEFLLRSRRERQGEAYTEAYHREVMIPSMEEAKNRWRETAQVVVVVRNPEIDGEKAFDRVRGFWELTLGPEVHFLWDERSTPEDKKTSKAITDLLAERITTRLGL